MLDRQHLIQGHQAAHHGDAEGHCATFAAHPAFHAAGGVVEQDALVAGHVHQAAVGAIDGAHRISGAAAVIGSVAATEGSRHVDAVVQRQVGFIHFQADVVLRGHVDAWAVIAEGQEVAQVQAGAGLVAIGIGDGRS